MEVAVVIGFGLLIWGVIAFNSGNRRIEERMNGEERVAAGWFASNPCPNCGGSVLTKYDASIGYTYRAECTDCSAKFKPTHNNDAPWQIVGHSLHPSGQH